MPIAFRRPRRANAADVIPDPTRLLDQTSLILLATLKDLGVVLGGLATLARTDPEHFAEPVTRLAPAATVAGDLAVQATHTSDPAEQLQLAASAVARLTTGIRAPLPCHADVLAAVVTGRVHTGAAGVGVPR